jgi:hypothetical protein
MYLVDVTFKVSASSAEEAWAIINDAAHRLVGTEMKVQGVVNVSEPEEGR